MLPLESTDATGIAVASLVYTLEVPQERPALATCPKLVEEELGLL